MFEKQDRKSGILSKNAGHRPAFLLKMSLFHRCFSNILLVNTNYLVYPELEHWSEMGKKETLAQVFFCEFWEISKNTFSYRTPPVDASVQRS